MKFNKKIMAIVLIISLFAVNTMSVFAEIPGYGEEYANQPSKSYNQIFHDVNKTHWAFEYIMEMNSRGILSGYPNGNFYPENTITRAEFAKIMCLAAGLKVSAVDQTSYTDVESSAWYAPYVETGKYYLSGYVSGTKKYYRPDSNALREDIAVALVKLKGYDTSVYDESILKAMFTDWQSISEDARKYVSVAVEKGLVSGYEDNTFRGQATLTRAEASTLMWRAYQYGSGNKVFEEEKEMEPENTKKEEVVEKEPDPLTLSLTASKTSYTVEEGETVEIKITVNANEEGEYIPEVDGDTDILSEEPDVSIKGNNTICEYETDELEAGKYELTFSIKDASRTHEKTIKITVEEPEPEYTYEMDTLVSDVPDIYSTIATKDSYVYISADAKIHYDGSGIPSFKTYNNVVIYEVTKDGKKKTLLDENDIEYLGSKELTKRELADFNTYIFSLGYNEYDECPYVIFSQFSEYYLYNLYTEEYTKCDIPSNIDMGNWKPKRFCINNGEIVFCSAFNFDNTGIVTIDGDVYKTKQLCYINDRTGRISEVDWYIDGAKIFTANNKNHFAVKNDEIYMVDTNGDHELLFTKDDIDNVDKRVINFYSLTSGLYDIQYTVAADNEGTIYFYDEDYNSIRCIRKK